MYVDLRPRLGFSTLPCRDEFEPLPSRPATVKRSQSPHPSNRNKICTEAAFLSQDPTAPTNRTAPLAIQGQQQTSYRITRSPDARRYFRGRLARLALEARLEAIALAQGISLSLFLKVDLFSNIRTQASCTTSPASFLRHNLWRTTFNICE